MLNTVRHKLMVQGPIEDLEEIRDRYFRPNEQKNDGRGVALDLDLVLPIPRGLTEAQQLRWCLENWGTTSNTTARGGGIIEPENDDPDFGILACHFVTEVAPPMRVLEVLAIDWPYVSFSAVMLDEGNWGGFIFNEEVGFSYGVASENEAMARAEIDMYELSLSAAEPLLASPAANCLYH